MFWLGLALMLVSGVVGFTVMLAAGSANRYPRAYDWIIYGCMAAFVVGVLMMILGTVR